MDWYQHHGRHDLPWQKKQTPYRVWVSEIMLQQTQVATVIPYYQRFLKTLPNLKTLAHASEDLVLSLWSGLGYYSRARNLHKTAKIIISEYGGRFPREVDTLTKLPGIGRSTAGAICSFSMQASTSILDGNVKRVLTRVFAIDEPITKTPHLQKLWNLAEMLTPQENTHLYNQSMMDLGATICTRTQPKCLLCPVQSLCQAHAKGNPLDYPAKLKSSVPRKKKELSSYFLLCSNEQQELLLLKRPSSGIWAGLWSLPECPLETSPIEHCKHMGLHPYDFETYPMRSHHFTHFLLHLHPIHLKVSLENPNTLPKPHLWYTPNTIYPGGIAAPIATLIQEYQHEQTHFLQEVE